MTNEPGTSATSNGVAAVRGQDRDASQRARGALPLAGLALAWLAATIWLLYRAISTSITDSIAVASAAIALPNVVSASLVAGTAAGLAAGNVAARRRAHNTTLRFCAGVGAGLVTGLLAALVVVGAYEGDASMILAGTVAAATTVGGAVAGVRAATVVAAVVAAGLAVFAVVVAVNYLRAPLLSLYGAGATPASQENAAGWLAWTVSLGSGLAAGLTVFGYLRVAERRARESALRWPAYMIAGAGPGLLLLVAEVITRVGGGRMLAAANALSEADRAFRSQADSSRITFDLIVLFAGALTAIIAFGRTLRPAPDAEADAEA
jgi:hypothetical protein